MPRFCPKCCIKGAVQLNAGFFSQGKVSLLGTTASALECEGGRFINPKGDALIAECSVIKGPVNLRKGFLAKGRVSLLRVTSKSLECDGGRFINPEGDALIAEGSIIEGPLFLRNGFLAEGRVSLNKANISILDCDGGKFYNLGRYALRAEGVQIKGAVLLRNGFLAKGKVSFLGAHILGNLNCTGGKFINPQGDSLSVESAEISGLVRLADGFEANGRVSFAGAIIKNNFECSQGKFFNPNKEVLVALNTDFHRSVVVDQIQAQGRIVFVNSTIDNDFYFKTKKIIIIFRYFFQMSKYLQFISFLKNGLNYDKQSIGSIYKHLIENGASSYDCWILFLTCILKQDIVLDLRSARIRTLNDRKDSWPGQNNLYLDGLVYDFIDHSSPRDSVSRLKWLRLQNYPDMFSIQPYEQLAKVLKENGENITATEILINEKKDLYKHREFGYFDEFWNWFLGWTISYGYRPQGAFYLSIVIICIGWFIFSCGYLDENHALISPSKVAPYKSSYSIGPLRVSSTPISASQKNTSLTSFGPLQLELSSSLIDSPLLPDYPKFHPLIYSLDTFIPIIDFHQQNYWLPNADREISLRLLEPLTSCWVRISGKLWRWYLWIHIALGWIFTSLWVVGFTGLVRRL